MNGFSLLNTFSKIVHGEVELSNRRVLCSEDMLIVKQNLRPTGLKVIHYMYVWVGDMLKYLAGNTCQWDATIVCWLGFVAILKGTGHDSIFQFSLFSTLSDIFAV